jgi:hypothetical protein
MHVRVAFEPEATVELEDPDDCSRLHLEIQRALRIEQVAWLLSRTGVGELLDVGRATLRITALRALADGRVSEDWDQRFDEMIGFARGHGWVADDGTSLHAHCEWKEMPLSAYPE